MSNLFLKGVLEGMQNYLSKENLGLPTSVGCIIAVLAGYGIYSSAAYLWIAALIAVVVYSLNFDVKIKTTLKQSYTVAAFLTILRWAVAAVGVFLNWFMPAVSYDPDSFKESFRKVLTKVLSILDETVTIVVLVIFAILLLRAVLGKSANISALDRVTAEKPVCPNCKNEISKGSAFCTKCGTKLIN